MSSKDTENKTINQHFKTFFKLNKKSGTIKTKTDFVLTDEIQRDISCNSPTTTRIKVIKELNEAILTRKLEESVIAKICGCIKDLFESDQIPELRHLAFQCLQCLVTGQCQQLNLVRRHIFQVIQKNTLKDVAQLFDLFQSLTEHGKNMLHFEEEVAPFLLDWFTAITKAGKTQEYMLLLDNFIKYNSAYIDEDVITGFVQQICVLCCSNSNEQIVLACLQILETIIAYYRILPPDSLPQFIAALCRVVNCKAYCETSYKIMRNLLGTHMGHSTMFTMCRILQEPALSEDTVLIQGAVFYINMGLGLWGPQPLTNLRCPPSSVLPAILQAVQCNQPAVTFEVVIGLQHLISKFGNELQDPVWDILLQILALVIKQIESYKEVDSTSSRLCETLKLIENLIECGNYNGNIKQFLEIIEESAASRPESSVMRLITYLSDSIVPTKHLWLGNLNNLLHRYYTFENEHRTNIRLKVLDVLTNVVQLNRLQFEDDLVDKIVLPHLINLPLDNDYKIRSAGAALLIELCMESESKRCFDMFEILEKLLNRPFELHANNNNAATDSETADVKTVVSGLIQVFIVKIHKLPSMHAVKLYKILVTHLELHYAKPKVFENCNYIRIKIFDCFLKMRADSFYRIGCPGANGVMKFSPYLCVTYRNNERGPLASPPPASPAIQQTPCTVTYVPMRSGFKIVIVCLKQEKDWDVLNGILQQLPLILQNKSLILSRQGNNDIGLFVDTICNMVTDKSKPESLQPLNKTEYFSAVLTVLPGLGHYHAYIEPVHQQSMILLLCSFKFGLNQKCSRQCITALTTCTLEMQDVMCKILPSVLLILSKSSSNMHIAIPVLEFLSTLTILPSVFSCFVADQYMAVFAILLPYTNPFKYNHYTVSLAHHVIAVWFLKCRLSFRKDFVRFITNGLQTNALKPFEETKILPADFSKLNQDSSDRKRSSSLTEQRSARRERTGTTVSRMDCNSIDFRPPADKTLIPFYEELTETCIDLMARYTFSPCSALPRRLPTAEFLLSGGQSMSWLLGNRVITVTTSGCAQKALKHGLCDKCFNMCKTDFNKTEHNILRTSRSGSNDKDDSTRVTRQNSGSNNNTNPAGSPIEENKRLTDKLEQLPGKLQQLQASSDANSNERQRCACWCQGWAEIYVRRPTGDMSWIMRIQNQTSHQHAYDFPLNDVSTLFMPSLNNSAEYEAFAPICTKDEEFPERENQGTVPISIPGSPNKHSPSRQNSKDSINDDCEYIYEDGTKARNPVRRSNSSPEMSANWKNPFMFQKPDRGEDSRSQDPDENNKKSCVKNFGKDTRVSCEAIPEEIAGMGTTPPSCNILQTSTQHPSLLSSLSYPGPVSNNETSAISKPYQTVPVSPNLLTNQNQPFQSAQPLAQTSAYPTKLSLLKTSKSDSTESISSEKSIERPTNLPNLTLMPLSNKPPQSPTQTSPRMTRHVIKDRDKRSGSIEQVYNSDPNFSTQKRDRGYTISVMSPARNKPRTENIRHATNRGKEIPKSGINPSFIFLQLYHTAQFGSTSEKPLLVNSNEIVQRALKVLDWIPPYETHKVGVIYIGQGQCNNEMEILKNTYGSVRYNEFLKTLGTLIKFQEVDPQVFFLGGLDQNGGDGKFAYIWQDDVIRVMFHVATLMPNKDSDPNCNQKKSHIGNDHVTIVYNESGEEYNINTIKGQFNFACIVIQPLDHNSNRVTVKAKDEIQKLIGQSEPKIVSDQNVAILARQLALHANLASLVLRSLQKENTDPYASNWLERLRKIKNLRNKVKQEQVNDYAVKTKPNQMEDFTYYT